MKYKIGDKVKIISAARFKDYIGQVGTIEKYNVLYWIRFKDGKLKGFPKRRMGNVYKWIKL